MLEKHAEHLEDLVAGRTQELHEEKKKVETLLYNILPRYQIQVKIKLSAYNRSEYIFTFELLSDNQMYFFHQQDSTSTMIV
jgi:hypothetical protein